MDTEQLIEPPVEWFVRDKVTGNFVRQDPPVQFTGEQLKAMAEEKVASTIRVKRLEEAQRQFLAAFERVKPAIAVAFLHRERVLGPYTGSTCETELEALRTTLAEGTKESSPKTTHPGPA